MAQDKHSPQKQEGYVTVTVTLPLGDITANQLRDLADIVRHFTKETIRTTVEQNFVIRWVSQADLNDIYEALRSVRPGRSRGGHPHRYHRLPGHRHVQAGNLLFARPRLGAPETTRPKKLSDGRGCRRISTSRSAGASTVAVSITWPTWVSMVSAAK